MNPVLVKYGIKTNKKAFNVLKFKVFGPNTINHYLIKISKINCNFIYKRCRVATDLALPYHISFSDINMN